MKYLIQHFIDQTFSTRPDNEAIRQGKQSFTYREIDQEAQAYCSHFIEQNCHKLAGAAKSEAKPVGILSRVRKEAITLMIGALRAGVVYVPLNTLAPAKWLGSVIERAGIEVLFYDSEFEATALALRDFGIKKLVCLDDKMPNKADGKILSSREILAQSFSHSTCQNTLADDIAYILYTSGSTGSPKGIMITHRNAFTFIDWMQREFKLTEKDRVFNRAPLQFDLSVFDIFSTFAAGATLLIAPLDSSKEPTAVLNFMREEKASIIYTVPSTYIGWLSKGDLERGLPDLRLLLYAGEPFPLPYLRKLAQALPHTQISNIYGPTETNIVTYYHLYGPQDIKPDWDSVPIGKVVHDTEAFIVDEDLKPVAPGQIGEILIRGGTVFAGYFNDPERTRERLIQSPFHNYPTLCCRTGDLGRFLEDGNIVYHGRADSMVKTRGYRVEIGEVEAAISSIDGVDEIAVIAIPHEKYSNTLHAFIVSSQNTLSKEMLEEELKEKLPSYMLPAEYILRRELPKTSTGKIDRVGLSQELSARKN